VSNIAIYNLLGEEVYSTTNHKLPASRQGGQTTNNIDVSALPSGVYLVKLITANGADVRKFIKE